MEHLPSVEITQCSTEIVREITSSIKIMEQELCWRHYEAHFDTLFYSIVTLINLILCIQAVEWWSIRQFVDIFNCWQIFTEN